MSGLNGFRPLGALFAVGLLLTVELSLARSEWLWSRVPMSPSGVIDALEERVIEPNSSVDIVFMGSSRVRDAIIPRQLERELDLEHGQVMNLGLTAGNPFDALTLYRRNRGKLSSARLIVFGVEDWHFNAAMPASERDRRFASWSESLGMLSGSETHSLLVSWIWRTYGAQQPLRRLVKSIFQAPPGDLPIGEDGRVRWRGEVGDFGPETVDVATEAHRFYRNFSPHSGRFEMLRVLIDLAHADGLTVMILQVPTRRAYREFVLEHYAREYAAYERAVRELPGVQVRIYADAQSLGLAETYFYDYGHLTPVGARIFTSETANWLREVAPN